MDKPALKILTTVMEKTQGAPLPGLPADSAETRVLIIADENFSALPINAALNKKDIHFLTHRYDVYENLQAAECSVDFNDLDLNDCQNYSDIYFRVSKEKPLSNHVLQSIFSSANVGTRLFLSGLKNEGIKGYYDKCRKSACLSASIIKEKDVYSVEIVMTSLPDKTLLSNFDSKQYTEIRAIETVQIGDESFQLFSKPGVFSWKSIDQGSQFLSETLHAKKAHVNPFFQGKTVLDLGCGHGHLSLVAASLGAAQIICTDNNAAALLACKQTCIANDINVSVTAADAGSNLAESVDAIVCNPPFHQGFSVSNLLVEKFVAAAARLLSAKGRAYFVCNVFVGIESLLQKHKLVYSELDRNRSFKVLEVRHQK